MNKDYALLKIQSDWKQRTGIGSEIEERMTPEGRIFQNLLEDIPYSVTETILNGISIKVTEGKPPRIERSPQAKMFSALCAGLSVILGGGICAFCNCSAIASILVITAFVFVATFFADMLLYRNEIRRMLQVKGNVYADWNINENALENVLDLCQARLEKVFAYVKSKEEDASKGFDITSSKSFGEWVQKFTDYSNRHQDNSDLNALKDELISKLATMGITVYDSLMVDEASGKLQLPKDSWYKDMRAETKNEFSEVRHAVVSSRRGILAAGELR